MLKASGLTVVLDPRAAADCEMVVDIKVLSTAEPQKEGQDKSWDLKVMGAVTLSAGGFGWSRRLWGAASLSTFNRTSSGAVEADRALWGGNLTDELVRMIAAARGSTRYGLLVPCFRFSGADTQRFIRLIAMDGRPAVKPLIAEVRNSGNRRLVALLQKLPFDTAQDLAGRLDDDRWFPQLCAVWALGRLGDPEAVEALAAALADDQLDNNAARALGDIGDRRAARPLLGAILTRPASREDVLDEAADALERLWDPEIIAPLIEVLAHKDEGRRTAAARVIAAWLDPPVARTHRREHSCCIDMSDDDDYLSNRPSLSPAEEARRLAEAQARTAATRQALAAAIRLALAENKDPRRIALLCGAVLECRPFSDYDFGAIPEPKPMDWAAVEAPKIGRAAFAGLLALLNGTDPLVRAGAAVALGQIGDRRATAPLLAMVCGQEPEVRVRAAAAAALGILKDPEAVQPLLKALETGDWHVVACATYALGDIGDPRAVPALIAMVHRDVGYAVDTHTDLSAEVALGRMGKAAVAPLVEYLKKPDSNPALMSALGRVGEPAVEPVAPFLDAPDASVRANAVRALAAMKTPKAMPLLVKALQDKDECVREDAVEGLLYNHLPAALQPLLAVAGNGREDEHTRLRILDELPPDPRCIEPLTTILRRESSKDLFEYAALALGRIPDPKAVQALAACLKDEKDAVRRAAAATGLGASKDPAGLAALVAALRDADAGVCRNAVEALAARGDLAALPTLAELAEKNPDAALRQAAVDAIEAIERKNP